MAGKAVYQIEIGDEIIEFEGPDNLTEAQIEELANKELKAAKPGSSFKKPEYVGVTGSEFGEDDSSTIGAFLRGLPHDALFNWDDELAAAGNAAIPGLAALDELTGLGGLEGQQGPTEGGDFWDRLNANMASLQQQREADQELHPVADASGRIAGVLSTLPRAGAAALARAPQAVRAAMQAKPVSTAIVGGATGGGISGAGAGTPGNRAQSAALGAMTGTALGGGLAAGMSLGPAVAQYAKIFLNRGGDQEALGQIVKALERDGFDVKSPAGVAQLKSALEEFTGKPVSLADIGAATRSRAGVGLRSPSRVQQQSLDAVMARQAGQAQRLATDVRTNVAPRTDVHAIDDDLVAQRAAEAEKLRERALFEDAPDPALAIAAPEAGVERTIARELTPTAENPVLAGGRQSRIIDDPELQQLARLPLAQRALQAAVKQAEAERGLLATTGKSIDHLPDINAGSQLDMRTFDYLKRYLDDEVTRLYKRGDTSTFSAAEANQVKELRNALRERLRTVNPEYGDYLDAYAGSSEMIDSLRAGREFDQLDPEIIAKEQASRSTAGQELYRVGAARNLLDTIRGTKDTGNEASRLLNSDEARAQILATGVRPDAAAQLNRSVQQERVLNLLPQELAGSQTMQRNIAQADADAGAHMTLPFNPASSFGWAGMLGRKILEHTSVNRNEMVNQALLPRLLETNPAAIDNIITELEQAGNIAAAREMRRAQRLKAYTGIGAVSLGSPVAIKE